MPKFQNGISKKVDRDHIFLFRIHKSGNKYKYIILYFSSHLRFMKNISINSCKKLYRQKYRHYWRKEY